MYLSIDLPALITVIALLELMFFAFKVGMGRQKYNVPAPAVSGNEEWERYFRVQQNTIEQLIIFIPALWLFAFFVSETIGAAIGLLFVIGRPIYYMAYIKDPGSRTVGFLMGFFSIVVLLIGSLGGILYGFL
tara:strand:+ start:48616 stop:49011 length:396 start_codon:yes stop_codon:yes gene_type:complete